MESSASGSSDEEVRRAGEIANDILTRKADDALELARGTASAIERIAAWASAISAGGIGIVAQAAVASSADRPPPIEHLRWAVAAWSGSLLLAAATTYLSMKLRASGTYSLLAVREALAADQARIVAAQLHGAHARKVIDSLIEGQQSKEDVGRYADQCRRWLALSVWFARSCVVLAAVGMFTALVQLGLLPSP